MAARPAAYMVMDEYDFDRRVKAFVDERHSSRPFQGYIKDVTHYEIRCREHDVLIYSVDDRGTRRLERGVYYQNEQRCRDHADELFFMLLSEGKAEFGRWLASEAANHSFYHAWRAPHLTKRNERFESTEEMPRNFPPPTFA